MGACNQILMREILVAILATPPCLIELAESSDGWIRFLSGTSSTTKHRRLRIQARVLHGNSRVLLFLFFPSYLTYAEKGSRVSGELAWWTAIALSDAYQHDRLSKEHYAQMITEVRWVSL